MSFSDCVFPPQPKLSLVFWTEAYLVRVSSPNHGSVTNCSTVNTQRILSYDQNFTCQDQTKGHQTRSMVRCVHKIIPHHERAHVRGEIISGAHSCVNAIQAVQLRGLSGHTRSHLLFVQSHRCTNGKSERGMRRGEERAKREQHVHYVSCRG